MLATLGPAPTPSQSRAGESPLKADSREQAELSPASLSNARLNKIDELVHIWGTVCSNLSVFVLESSSGKSSLLEALTGITFPKARDMCTTFPTGMVMAPSLSFSAKVFLNPDPKNKMRQNNCSIGLERR
ncbi:hypothetical protein M427DRAFT_60728 [Gonapodya prolifera JEL478]|uniref:Dynamin-type G domain-containing protein n=1 Tax=Gonapodya prolifera (strain JEL478) TaxID=1344416 RepID=A0A139A4B3_GONPJ|nr:hypothetical protein M427DRAFT_60728 [Gonapodya prolifera JEL478]|eukprot:KXS11315.1 hypothetical protein M427DRAFT_60728 [Gonapodya prolifera JEL478]